MRLFFNCILTFFALSDSVCVCVIRSRLMKSIVSTLRSVKEQKQRTPAVAVSAAENIDRCQIMTCVLMSGRHRGNQEAFSQPPEAF